MIAFLLGNLAAVERGERSAIILNVQGVGYRVKVAERLLKTLPAIGDPVQVFTHLAVRETEMLLYGFGSAPERDLFVELIKVAGIGPALGLALLNTLTLSELIQAILTNNTRVLSLTPGVGAKTAQRLALELKSKLSDWRVAAGMGEQPLAATGDPAIREEVEMALLALGYSPQEMTQALTQVARQSPPASTEAWLKAAIALLSER
ncbi:MAG: Holliday junction branch migration protein RuvA [Cyanobacteriota bacterium]|nr:Holliday junction branch migration protein RuvA [Cyanobacteriota bacterium]